MLVVVLTFVASVVPAVNSAGLNTNTAVLVNTSS